MGIETKTLAALIDELITTSLRCWFAQERVMNGKTDKEIAEASVLAQKTNKRRNELMRAIDEKYGDVENTVQEKSY